MTQAYKVGLTGGIGSGKSTVANMFMQLGVVVIDADKISHQLTQCGQPVLAELTDEFGKDILDINGNLIREVLREKIFKDKNAKLNLENILHPKIYTIIEKNVREIDTGYCILSIPLLIETGAENLVDSVLIVDCSEDLQIKRILERNGITPEIAKNIIDTQVDRSERLIKGDEVINNNGTLEDLENQVLELHNLYTERSKSRLENCET